MLGHEQCGGILRPLDADDLAEYLAAIDEDGDNDPDGMYTREAFINGEVLFCQPCDVLVHKSLAVASCDLDIEIDERGGYWHCGKGFKHAGPCGDWHLEDHDQGGDEYEKYQAELFASRGDDACKVTDWEGDYRPYVCVLPASHDGDHRWICDEKQLERVRFAPTQRMKNARKRDRKKRRG